MNRYPLWKYLLILCIVVVGFIYALPNAFEPDPAIQISGSDAGFQITETAIAKATAALDREDIAYFGVENDGLNAQLRFNSVNDQLRGQSLVADALGEVDFVVAVSLAHNTPQWLVNIGGGPMKRGLDLAGGVHFLLEVDTPKVLQEEANSILGQIKSFLRQEKLRGVFVSIEGLSVIVKADTEEKRDTVTSYIRKEVQQLDYERSQKDGAFIVTGTMKDIYIREKELQAVEQNLTALRKRVDEINVSEPLIQRQGRNRIVVQLPGIQDTARAKAIIGKAASLEFRLEARPDARASQKELFPYADEDDQRATGGAYLEKKIIIKGDDVNGASAGFHPETSQPQINIKLNSAGGKKMYRSTSPNVGRSMAVLFIEYHTRTTKTIDENGNEKLVFTQIPEKKIINRARINEALNMNFVITGIESSLRASETALLLRAGALAAPMGFVEERTIGPSMGAENVRTGTLSVQIGFALVLLFMLVYYRVFGIAANIALTLNLVLLLAAMSIFGATLTLPGIAGIVLTVGMAVDANVLIFSRIREEVANGLPPQTAIKSGFDRAFITILDANITTFIVAIILYAIGSGPVKGFAVTLAIGIVTSMFTAIMGTRAIVNLIYGNRQIKKLSI